MFDIQAALLLPQLRHVEARLERREEICRRYEHGIREMKGVEFPVVVDGARSARHLFTIWVPGEHRDTVLAELQARGIGVAVNYRAVHLLTYYRETFGFTPGTFPNAERVGDSTITLPLYPSLSNDQVDEVLQALAESVAAARYGSLAGTKGGEIISIPSMAGRG
jgi:UDP-4-amino-4-deoxy-L-arabinose-oxoglutarate aminotransferase